MVELLPEPLNEPEVAAHLSTPNGPNSYRPAQGDMVRVVGGTVCISGEHAEGVYRGYFISDGEPCHVRCVDFTRNEEVFEVVAP